MDISELCNSTAEIRYEYGTKYDGCLPENNPSVLGIIMAPFLLILIVGFVLFMTFPKN